MLPDPIGIIAHFCRSLSSPTQFTEHTNAIKLFFLLLLLASTKLKKEKRNNTTERARYRSVLARSAVYQQEIK